MEFDSPELSIMLSPTVAVRVFVSRVFTSARLFIRCSIFDGASLYLPKIRKRPVSA
jgi:hypothetical protein